MYFDRRLWQLTHGLRRWIAIAILMGMIASAAGIARFAILGVLLSHVFNGAGFLAVAVPAVGVAAAVLLRGYIEHHRAMISHRTATRVQETLRGPVMASLPFYDRAKVVALLDDLPALDDAARTALDPVLTILLSACCLHRRYFQ